jgi:DNA-binding MurR/RpiR family transcriptional regulator
MDVAQRIAERAGTLTKAERRVAEVVLARPQVVAFGTVAGLAEEAGAGAATVVRLAAKLGFDGFSGLQAAVQGELARRLRPAVERIREPAADDLASRHLASEVNNVHVALSGADPAVVERVAGLLGDLDRRVLVLSGDASRGVALQLGLQLDALRDGVELLEGNEVQVHRRVSALRRGDVVVAIDLPRYDRWVVEALRAAQRVGALVVAITDRRLSPLADGAAAVFVVAAESVGPFDSHVGTVALGNLLVAAVAVQLRASAVERLDRAEAAWQAAGALEPGA